MNRDSGGRAHRVEPGPNARFLRVQPGAAPPVSGRVGRALSLSLGAHLAGAVVLVLMANGRSGVPIVPPQRADRTGVSVVWLPVAADTAGGREAGGREPGGDGTPAPARTVEVRGTDQISMPVVVAPDVRASAEPQSGPDRPAALTAPIQPVASGLQNLDGMLRPVPLGDPNSLGPAIGDRAGPGRGAGSGSDGPAGPGIGDGPGGRGGIISPRLVTKIDPQYTVAAMQARIQGTVILEAIVLADGSVGDVKIARSLDSAFGLDQSAIKAVKGWRFTPGTRAGTPLPVIVSIELTFTLR